MKVFLSGKVDDAGGAWRNELLGVEYEWRDGERIALPRWQLRFSEEPEYEHIGPLWPEEPNRWVLGLHDYVGPYKANVPGDSKHLGVFHGSWWASTCGHGEPTHEHRVLVTSQCLSAIRHADLVFAYINTPDCFGTLVEIGYARAMGVYVHVVTEADATWESDDYWFAAQVANSHQFHWQWDAEKDQPRPVSITDAFREALVQFTAAPPKAKPVLLPSGVAESFTNIARWSADPRVRNEAQRMLKALR